MNVILQRIVECLELAQTDEVLLYHAIERYNLATWGLMALVASRDAGQIILSVDEEQELMRVREFLLRHLPELKSKMESGEMVEAKARATTPEEAMFDIMEELLAELKG